MNISLKFVAEIHVSLQSDKNNG